MYLRRVYQVGSVKADWNCIKTLPDLSGTGFSPSLAIITCLLPTFVGLTDALLFYSFAGRATCLKFGPDANYIAVGSMDRNLRVFGLPGDEAPLES